MSDPSVTDTFEKNEYGQYSSQKQNPQSQYDTFKCLAHQKKYCCSYAFFIRMDELHIIPQI
jgi:hypothetical protein